MGATRVSDLGQDLTIANGQTASNSLSHEHYGDAEALMFFCPAGLTSVTVQVSDNGTDWYTLITGITPVTITTAVAVAVAIIPPAAQFVRILAGGAVSGAKTIAVQKMWKAFGG